MNKKCPNCKEMIKEKNNYMAGEHSLRCKNCGLIIEEGKYGTVSNWDADNQKLLGEVIKFND